MSGLKNEKLAAFQRWARANGWTQEELAYECDCNRAHISLVLAGERAGRYTWRRLVKVLPAEAVLLLQQCPSWNTHAADAWKKRQEREAARVQAEAEARKFEEIAARCRGELLSA